MINNKKLRHGLQAATLLACILDAGVAAAAEVYKCIIDGKASYQAEPCKSSGKTLSLSDGPSKEQIQEANKRAAIESERSNSMGMQRKRTEENDAWAKRSTSGQKADCKSLNKELADAYGRRNATFRKDGAGTFVAPKLAAEQEQRAQENLSQSGSDIARIQSAMRQGGC